MSEVADIAAPLTASQMLKTAREAAGLTQDQVAQELYLTPSYIRLIDSDEIDKIAKQAFVRGYLRSYAKLVQVDDDEVVARFERSQGGVQPKIEMGRVTKESIGSTNFTGPVFQTGVLGLVGLIVVVALVWFLTSSEDEPVTVGPASSMSDNRSSEFTTGGVAVSAEAPDEFDAATDESGQPVFGNSGNAMNAMNAMSGAETADETDAEPLVALLAESELAPSTASAPVLAEASEVVETAAEDLGNLIDENIEATEAFADSNTIFDESPQLSERQIQVQRDGSVISVAAGGDDELRFVFSDECWVEIEDAQGDSIYGDLNRAGEELIVSGIAPFEVLFGKAPAVRLEYNGVPIDLIPHTTSVDTAKLKVGN